MLNEYDRLFKAHQFLEARNLAKEAFQIDPDSPVTMSMLALSNAQNGPWEFKKLIRTNRSIGTASWKNLNWAYARRREMEKVLKRIVDV